MAGEGTWLSRVHHWWRDDFLGPRNKRRFKVRIAMRVRWLRLRQWWRYARPREGLRHLPRPLLLVVLGLAVPGLTLLLLSRALPVEAKGVLAAFRALVDGVETGAPPTSRLEWREALQLLLLVIGLPSAFILWLFRDIHVNETLANQRKDVNLKEFQEIQMRAAGVIDEKFPAHARETLQIAAIHQLRSVVRGDYGASFRRPAWELLRARLATSARETGTRAIVQWVMEYNNKSIDPNVSRARWAEAKLAAINSALTAIRPAALSDAERTVIREEHRFIFRADLPLTDSCFDRVDLSRITLGRGALLASLIFARSTFVGADLSGAHLEGVDLSSAHLQGARLKGAHLEHADLFCAYLEGVDLEQAHLEGAELSWAHLEGAKLSGAHFEGADLSFAHLEGADLSSAHLEGAILSGADLDNASLARAHLNQAYLRGVNFKGAYLGEAHLEGTDLYGAQLQGADLSDAHLGRAELAGAYFDDDTRFTSEWDEMSEDDRAPIRDQFCARGMRHVDDPEDDGYNEGDDVPF